MISLTQWQMPPHRYSLSHNDICTSVSAKVRSYLSRNRLVFWRLLCLFPSECEMGPNSFVCLGEFCLCFSYSSGLGGRGKLKVWQVYSQWFWMSLLASTLQSTGLRTPFYDRANIGDDPGHILSSAPVELWQSLQQPAYLSSLVVTEHLPAPKTDPSHLHTSSHWPNSNSFLTEQP